jgi:hypothetical protein
MRNLFSRGRRYEELAQSMPEHLAERVDELVSEGMAREDAEFTARRGWIRCGRCGVSDQVTGYGLRVTVQASETGEQRWVG